MTLQFDLVMDGKPIAGSIIRNVDVEEKYHETVKTVITYPEGIIEQDPAPVLKIVMTVEDDDLGG